jgi:hypothetical protein
MEDTGESIIFLMLIVDRIRMGLSFYEFLGYMMFVRVDLDHIDSGVQIPEVNPFRIPRVIFQQLTKKAIYLNSSYRNRGLKIYVMPNRIGKHFNSLVEPETGHFLLNGIRLRQFRLCGTQCCESEHKEKKKNSVMFHHTGITSQLWAKLKNFKDQMLLPSNIFINYLQISAIVSSIRYKKNARLGAWHRIELTTKSSQ